MLEIIADSAAGPPREPLQTAGVERDALAVCLKGEHKR